MTRRFLLCLLLLAAIPGRATLPEAVRARLAAAGIPEDAVGVVVRRLSDGVTVLAHRDDASLQPASTLKLVTSLAAIETLGPAFRSRTQLLASGEVRRGTLRGDLVLRGGGDVDFDWQALEGMLSRLRLQGVREIRGDLVIDLGRFRPARTDVGFAPFDEAPEFRYNVVPDALLLNTYLVRLDLVAVDGRVAIRSTPSLEKVAFVSDLRLVEGNCEDWEDGWKPPAIVQERAGRIVVRLQGEYPRDCTASTEINVLDRIVYVDRLFRALWRGMGGSFRGVTREGATPQGARVLGEHASRPLSEVLRDINKNSDNPIARVTYLTLGAERGRDPASDTVQRAEQALREWLAARGVHAEGLVLENGSGLSRIERIRPRDLAAVLEVARASRWAPEFVASLPIVAVDGGMRGRLASSPAAEVARLKTGTLRDVSAIAGYVPDALGREQVVVAMINHPLADRKVARPILDVLVDWVARQGGPIETAR